MTNIGDFDWLMPVVGELWVIRVIGYQLLGVLTAHR